MARRGVTEEKLDAALRVVRQWYFDEIRAIVEEAKTKGEDEVEDYLHETIDGHEFVIYTYKARLVMICTDHPDAFEEEMGDKPETVEQAAYGAMMADVRDGL
jgi:hypothetical protein